jgi:bifunctional DNA-binding transcriptional regulator/antitoxin component of YhaV-PrlF toxin-antitoxin module
MSKLTVTAKGQVALGKDLLQHLGVRPGDVGRVVSRTLPSPVSDVALTSSTLKRDGFHSTRAVDPTRAPLRCGSRADG